MIKRNFLLYISCFVSLALFSQKNNQYTSDLTPAKTRLQNYEQHLRMNASSPFKNLKWKNISPDTFSGRVTDIEVAKNDPTTIYVGAASGGIWKSINNKV